MISSIVDSVVSVFKLVDQLATIPSSTTPSIYIDIEGICLGRLGSVSIIQLYGHRVDHVYLIDIHVLQNTAFTTSGIKHNGRTLKSILESPTIFKAFFDVRNDSDALYSHYGIALQGVVDIQLMENASRSFGKKFLSGLQKCIDKDAPINYQERSTWNSNKAKGVLLFAPEKGGNYKVFNERPLKEEILQYCVQDVQFLPKLYELYRGRLAAPWTRRVEDATLERVRDSHRATYQSIGRDRTLGPWQGIY